MALQRRRTVSVVVPAWNRAALLPDTLDHILAQDSPAEEVLVMDDGSDDATPDVLAAYRRRGVRGIRVARAGDLAARNVGLRAAVGTLVAFCDSDDLWRPGLLSAMHRLWQAEPRTRTAYSDFTIVRDGTWGTGSKFQGAPAGFWDGLRGVSAGGRGEGGLFVFDTPVPERLVRYQPFFPSCLVVVRRFLLDIGGWDEGASPFIGRDFATALRIAEHTPLGIVRQPLVGIRKHAANDSGDVLAMNLGDSDVLEYALRTRPSLAPHAGPIRASIAARRAQALDIAFARRDFGAVRGIARLLGADALSRSARLKHGLTRLPEPVRSALAAVLLSAGTVRARIAPRRLRDRA